MPYIGKSPSQATRKRYYKTASGSETSISGTMTVGGTLTFTDGEFVDVSVNGVALVAGTDYNTNTANTIAGLSALSANDQVEIIVYDTFSVFSGDVDSNMSVGGNLSVTGTATLTGNADFNGDLDVDGTTNLDVVDIDGAVDMASTLQVDGAITSSAGATITTADNTSQLTLVSTDADATAGPRLDLKRDSGSPADSDSIGRIRFLFDNDGAEQIEGVRVDAQIGDASDGTEDVAFEIQTMVGGTLSSRMATLVSETIFNEDSKDLDFRVESNGNTHAIFVDAGNDVVAIGNSTPNSFNANAKNLVVGTGSGSNGITIFAGNTSDSAIFFADNGSTATGQINYKHADNAFTFHTNSGTERMRIDSSGNLLVGGTETNPQNQSSGAGSALRADGRGLFRCADANALAANRTGSDGEIIRIGRDGSTIAQIKSISGPQIALVQGSTGLAFYNGGNQIYPTDGSGNRDATIDLGYSSSMFKDGYFSGTVFAEAFTGRADTDTSIQMAGSNRIKFFTASSERMRIDDDDILFGTSSTSLSDAGIKFANTSATHKYAVFTHTASSASESLLYINRQSSDGTAIFFRRANTNVGSISVDSSSTSYNTSSDRRLKSNIQDAESASDKIDALQVRQFDWNVDGSHQDFGLVAQELQPIAPNAVLGDADSDEMMSVDYSKLVPLLIKFSQEQQATIKSLETRLAALENA